MLTLRPETVLVSQSLKRDWQAIRWFLHWLDGKCKDAVSFGRHSGNWRQAYRYLKEGQFVTTELLSQRAMSELEPSQLSGQWLILPPEAAFDPTDIKNSPKLTAKHKDELLALLRVSTDFPESVHDEEKRPWHVQWSYYIAFLNARHIANLHSATYTGRQVEISDVLQFGLRVESSHCGGPDGSDSRHGYPHCQFTDHTESTISPLDAAFGRYPDIHSSVPAIPIPGTTPLDLLVVALTSVYGRVAEVMFSLAETAPFSQSQHINGAVRKLEEVRSASQDWQTSARQDWDEALVKFQKQQKARRKKRPGY